MSLALNIEEGTAGQVSRERREETNSFSGSFQRGPHSGFEIQGISRIGELPTSNDGKLAKFLLRSMDLFHRKGLWGEWYFLFLCGLANCSGSSYLYMPVVNDDKKCLELNKDVRTMDVVGQILLDLWYMVFVIFQLRFDLQKNARKRLWLIFLVDLLVVLPIGQVLLILFINQKMTRMNLMFLFELIPLQYCLRFIRMYPLFRYRSEAVSDNWSNFSGILRFISLIFVHCYFEAASVIGSMWYYFAVKRLTECWKKACIDHTGCGSFYCDDGFANHTFLNDFFPTKTLNTTIFDFGIYYDALQSGIVDVKFDNAERKIYTFRWALQNLSAFGQGLQTSVDMHENIFVIFITYFGVAFLIYIVGVFQISINYGSRGLFKMKLKNQVINRWLPFRRISVNLQQQIEKHPPNSWEVIKGVNVETLLNNLSKDLRSNIKRQLCLDLLKKVDEFATWNETNLDDLCDCLTPAFYDKRTRIVREGDLIDEMLFVLQGNLWTYSSRSTVNTPRRTDHNPSEQDLLEEGDFFGEELVAWARDDASSFNLPISTRTLQAITNVDAFVLMAYDLRKIFIKNNQELVSDNVFLVSSDQQQGEPEITAEEQ